MQEDTSADAKQPEEVLVLDAVKPWENVRFHGEDIKTGNVLARPGQIRGGALSSLLAAAGIKEVTVGRRPVVGLLATGSELREAGQTLAAGEIYESNRIGLAALLRAINCLPKVLPLVADVKQRVRAAMEDAFKECDVVVSTGGVSVGEFDFIKSAFEGIGGALQFWRVAIKPGRPFVFGRYQRKFLFGLPGNPVSALVTFALLVRPALLRWQGAPDVLMASHPGILAETMNNPGLRRHFMRVKIDRAGKIWSAGVQASHVLSSLAAANGLVDVPAEGSLSAGTAVQVLRWE